MKIIAGEKKGFPLVTPEGLTTRPTLTRVRESLFSIIAGDISGSVFCDLYCGAGTIGLEALSRGAERAIFIENDMEALRCLDTNVRKLGYQQQVMTYKADVSTWKTPSEFHPDIIFADPPYRAQEISELVAFLNRTPWKESTLLILQLPKSCSIGLDKFNLLRTKTYGKTAISFYLSI